MSYFVKMNSSNLIQLIAKLSKKERLQLRDFVKSPFHNNREEVIRLYSFVDTHLDCNTKFLNKQTAFAHLFPQEPYDDQKMRYTMSFLVKVIEEYLAIQGLKNDPLQEKLLLIKAYRNLKLEKAVRQAHRTIEKKFARERIHNAVFYEKKYQLELEKYLMTETQGRNTPRNLKELDELSDIAYFSRKLKQMCLQLAHQSVYRVEYDFQVFDHVLPVLESGKYKDIPAITLFFYYFQAFTKDDSGNWFQLFKEELIKNGDVFPEDEKRELYLLAINFTIKQFNLGEASYLRETFELYRSALEQQLLLEDGELSRFSFKNIASLGVRLEEFEWTKWFVEHYGKHVSNKYRKHYIHYSISKLQFAEGKYQEAMLRLQQVEYDDVFLNLDAKLILLRIYFKLEEFEVLDSYINSFRRFIQRKELMGYHKTQYLNILNFAKKIMDLNPYDSFAKHQLSQEIINADNLPEKEWLLSVL